MELAVKEQKHNPLLKRKELTGTLAFEGATPSNKELTEQLAKKLSVTAETIVMKQILGAFGGTKAEFKAYVYDSKEQLDKVEPKKKVKADANAPAAK
ncbi:hypothetical protein J4219_06945 [Candidatus Woesearchaeota archaeon]|nr:hypothetical protein [Candidatus Woesearchaeota archaeon]